MIEWGPITPWLDNWPISRQLWANPSKQPGQELDLTLPNRNLTVQWRDRSSGLVVLAYADGNAAIQVENPKSGVVTVRLTGEDWQYLKQNTVYSLEMVAYGYLYSSTVFDTAIPNTPSVVPLTGGNIYASPRQALALLMLAGTADSISEDLSGNWTLNPQGYWVRDIFVQVNGLWVNDVNYREATYEQLAISGDRTYAVVNNKIYLKSLSSPANAYVETAYNYVVYQSLQRAAAEVERKTGRCFAKRLNVREKHRGLGRQQQVHTKQYPVELNEYFKLDTFVQNGQLFRRYTENTSGESFRINQNTGAITLTSDFYDIWDLGGAGINGARVFSTIPKGEDNLEITYVSGYEDLPDQIRQAATNIAATQIGRFWKQQLGQGFDTLSIGCVNVNFSQLFSQFFQEWASETDTILGEYQRIDIDAL